MCRNTIVHKERTMQESPKVTWVSYLLLIVAILMFSGLFTKSGNILRALDFPALNGVFGTIAGAKGNFVGSGGTGARGGFLFALGLAPAIILALGIVRVVDGYGGLLAAEKLISPFFKPLLGIPGICGLAFITSLQSTDGAAGMTKELYDAQHINDDERSLFCMLQFSADGTITNYFSTLGAFFTIMVLPVGAPLVVLFLCKILGTNMLRFLIALDSKKKAAA
jgi:nucleoside recognition membrane protein YjiH